MLSTLLKNENAKNMNAGRGNEVLKHILSLKIPDLNTSLPVCKCLSLPHTSRQTTGEIKIGNRGLPFFKEVKEYQIAMWITESQLLK